MYWGTFCCCTGWLTKPGIVSFLTCTSWIRVFGAQHYWTLGVSSVIHWNSMMGVTWVPDFLHLNTSVISAFRKQVKLNKLTMHEPGHSSRGSGGDVVVGGGVAFVTCGRGLWVDAIRLLSQQTEPLLQFDVFDIKMAGRSQNAAIKFNKQNPGHLGRGAFNWT